MAKVSVCMLAYNTSAYIGEAIESVLSQKTNFDFELIIADNDSTDNTRQIIQEYKTRYPGIIKLVLNPANLGMSANFIKAYKNCSGEFIATLDSDDCWCDNNKLQKQVDFLEKNRDYGVVYSDCKVINEAGDEIEWKEMNYYRQQFTSGNIFFKLLKEVAFIPNLTTCFRKELITEELEKTDLWFYEDWWLWMRLSVKSKFYCLSSQTACYRLHANNYSATRKTSKIKLKELKRKTYAIFYSNILYFHNYNKMELQQSERELLTRKIMMLLYRRQGTIKMKLKLVPLFFKYCPGLRSFINLVMQKINRIKLLIFQFYIWLHSEFDYSFVSNNSN